MRKWLLAASILSLLLSLTACAHQEAAYGYGGVGAFMEDCEFGQDCYAGPQYTCVFYQPPVAPARLAIAVARHRGSPRVVGPHEGMSGGSGPSAPSTTTTYMPPAPAPARAPIVTASPSGGRSPQTRD
jgi:hypothetical protein